MRSLESFLGSKAAAEMVKSWATGVPMTRGQALALASDLVAGVRATLDTETEVCRTCQMHRHQNWDEKQAHDQLKSAEIKIRKWAKKL